jgi:hypothetical protein
VEAPATVTPPSTADLNEGQAYQSTAIRTVMEGVEGTRDTQVQSRSYDTLEGPDSFRDWLLGTAFELVLVILDQGVKGGWMVLLGCLRCVAIGGMNPNNGCAKSTR